ncbi:MAG: polysaccharide deacetylase family protein [Bryobacteraceae bacterium]
MKAALLLCLALPLLGQKKMAVTIDDLPWVGQNVPAAEAAAGTRGLLRVLKQAGVPAIGFANGNKIYGREDTAAWSAVLRLWIDAGFDLGNHTYSHQDLNKLTEDEYRRDVIEGERPWREWMARDRPRSRIFFRHPFTHTGGSAEKRTAFEAFLASRGYSVAPFTIENADYLFESIRARLEAKGDRDKAKEVEAAYLAHTAAMTGYFEQLSTSYFGRDIAQILLIHTNELNHRNLAAVLDALRRRGYRFVSLDEALRDPAYKTEDRFVGQFGPSWVHRWSIALGKKMDMRNEPDPPRWVLDLDKELRSAR